MNTSKIKETMKLLVHGVYIICVEHKGKVNGMTAAWVSQVSSNPPMVSIAVGKKHFTAQLISQAKKFSINIITPGQKELAIKCGTISGEHHDKLKDEEVVYYDKNIPVLDKCIAYLECDLTKQVDTGDHFLFIGAVRSADKKGNDVLIFKPEEF